MAPGHGGAAIMINQVRTLILNKSAAEAGLESGNSGAEYIDPSYRPLNLNARYQRVRGAFLRSDYTPYQENYMLAHIMQLLHAKDVEQYTAYPDPRFTYDISYNYNKALDNAAVTVKQWKSAGVDVEFRYNYYPMSAPITAGKEYAWEVKHQEGEDTFTVSTSGRTSEYRLEQGAENTELIQLVPDCFFALLHSDTKNFYSSFRFDVYVQMPAAISVTETLGRLNTINARYGDIDALFEPTGMYAEKIRDLNSLWTSAPEYALRFAAAALAYAYKLDESGSKR
jgi:hypothetical protein